MSNSDFQIGLKFIPPGKHPREHIIIDIHKTFNSKSELVRTEYVCEHVFCGQKVKSTHCYTTIARSKHIESLVDEVINDMMQFYPPSATMNAGKQQNEVIESTVQVAYWDSEIYKNSESLGHKTPFTIEITDQRKTHGGLYSCILPNEGNLDEMLLTRLEISRLPGSADDLPCLRVDFDDDNHAFSVFRRNHQFLIRLNNNVSLSQGSTLENGESIFVVE